MKVISSYKVEILKLHKPLKQTMEICRSAVSWLLPVIDEEWSSLSMIGKEKLRFNAAEKLIHGTKKNLAKYAFDAAFPKMPSYLRRAVLQHVMGAVSSAHTQKRKLQISGKCPERISRCDTVHYMPVFYRDNMYRKKEDGVYLKLYTGKDWIWQKVLLRKTDLDYIRMHWTGVKEKSPVLVKRYKKYYLQFAFEENVRLSSTSVEQSRICAVDLGINTDAVCSIMTADGTVAARKFISFPAEKDRLYHVLNRVRKKQREHGSKSVTGFWAYAKRLNDQIAVRTASAIVAFARAHDADVIVFEYLEMKGKRSGKKKQKLHMWKKRRVQAVAEHQAHRSGIRISRICAWGTSALACDGSGRLERDKGNHSLAVFQNGRHYNCDLSASYNIGARYYIRELQKSIPETEWSVLAAEVPGVQRRTSSVWADLIKINRVMREGTDTSSSSGGYPLCGDASASEEAKLSKEADRRGTGSGCLKQPVA